MNTNTVDYTFVPTKCSLFVSGKVKEICKIAYPLMLNSMSVSLMMFTDRMILSYVSSSAMNSASAAFGIFWSIQFAMYMISNVTETFVGQYNGSRRYTQIGPLVWQMIWFGLMTAVVFWPIGFFAGDILLTENFSEIGVPYFRWIMFFGPAFILVGPLSDFFIGRGRTKIVTYSIFLGISLNVVLDLISVFGLKIGSIQIISPIGTNGPAIATGISQIFQVLFLFSFFILDKNSKKYHTRAFSFNKNIFRECMKIGLPSGIAQISIATGSILFWNILANVESAYVTAFSICQSFYYLFWFVPEGIGKSIGVFTSNFIGTKNYKDIPKVLSFAVKIHLFFLLLLSVPMLIFPEFSISFFMGNNTTGVSDTHLIEIGKTAMLWMWIYCLFDGLSWNLWDLLNSSGDTRFLMLANISSTWLVQTIPAYLCFFVLKSHPSFCWKLYVFDMIVTCSLFWIRYKRGKWKNIQLTKNILPKNIPVPLEINLHNPITTKNVA